MVLLACCCLNSLSMMTAGPQHSASALPLSSELGPSANSPSSLPLEGDVPEHGALPLPGSGELGNLGTQSHGALPLEDAMQRELLSTSYNCFCTHVALQRSSYAEYWHKPFYLSRAG